MPVHEGVEGVGWVGELGGGEEGTSSFLWRKAGGSRKTFSKFGKAGCPKKSVPNKRISEKVYFGKILLQNCSTLCTYLAEVMQACLPGHPVCSIVPTVNVDSNLVEEDLLWDNTAHQQKNPKHTSMLAPKR